MKNCIFTTLLFLTVIFSANAQKADNLEEYTASNGVVYKVGDEIKLGRGSGANGRFVYVTIGGWAQSMNPEQNALPPGNVGLVVTVKKIKKYDSKRYKKVLFIVGGGNITNYNLDIESAIAECEIEKCKTVSEAPKSADDKFDKLKKLKELYDGGAITEGEYNEQKKKLLDKVD